MPAPLDEQIRRKVIQQWFNGLPRDKIAEDNNIGALHGPLKGKQVSDLANIIKAGQAYANVRTKQNPKGEIRGQIS
jgi:CHRD domain